MSIYAEHLQELYNKWEKRAKRADEAYQSTGIQRYNNDRRNAEDVCEAVAMAIRSEKADRALTTLRCFKNDAKNIRYMTGESRQKAINKLLWELEMCEEGER